MQVVAALLLLLVVVWALLEGDSVGELLDGNWEQVQKVVNRELLCKVMRLQDLGEDIKYFEHLLEGAPASPAGSPPSSEAARPEDDPPSSTGSRPSSEAAKRADEQLEAAISAAATGAQRGAREGRLRGAGVTGAAPPGAPPRVATLRAQPGPTAAWSPTI